MTSYEIPDGPKMLRETLCVALCVAQSLIGNSNLNADRRTEHVNRLQRLIAECDRHRPLGSDGKHGDLHTPTCGCEEDEVVPCSLPTHHRAHRWVQLPGRWRTCRGVRNTAPNVPGGES